MPFTGFAFYESVDNATLGNVATLASERKYFREGDDFRVPDDFNKLMGYHMLGDTTLTRGVLTSPSLRATAPIEILPIDASLEPTSNFPVNLFPENPLTLASGEQLNAQSENSGAAADNTVVLVWLTDGDIVPVTGQEILHVKASASIVCVAYEWSQGQITLDTDLPVGTYALVGARVQTAGGIAARFVPEGDAYRPMLLCYDSDQDIEDSRFRNGKLGTWFTFKHDTPPQIEILSTSADVSQELILDIVRVS